MCGRGVMPVSMAALLSLLNLCLLPRSSAARDDRLQREEDECFTAERRWVRETGLRFLCLPFIYYVPWKKLGVRGKQRERDRKSKDWNKSEAICYDFKLIKERVARWWGHLHMQVLLEQEHYGGNHWKKDLKGALINVSAGVEGTLSRR